MFDASDQQTQDLVRDKAAGRGLLYPDTFSEERLLFLPPAASVLLVILCRNHNVSVKSLSYDFCLSHIPFFKFVAERILKINEKKKWTDPPPTDPTKRAAQDEEIFQTARLIKYAESLLFKYFLSLTLLHSGGHFMSLIMGDYVAGFLGLSEGNVWKLNAFDVCVDLSIALP